jgi:hypothetical protein
MICLAWIFFRAQSVEDALYMIRHLADGLLLPLITPVGNWLSRPTLGTAFGFDLGVTPVNFWLSVVLIAGLLFVERGMEPEAFRSLFQGRSWWIRWPAYYALVYGLLVLGVFQKSQFIYFQF